jgi:hypothetical protein
VRSIPDCRTIEKSVACGFDQKRFHFAAQFGICLRQQRRALLGGALASRVV